MAKSFKYIISILLFGLLFCSCKRQHIYSKDHHGNSAKIYFDFDWTNSNLDLSDVYNVSIYAYPIGGNAPYVKVGGDLTCGYIYLPEGEYNLLVFNNAAGNVDGMDFQNFDSFDGFNVGVVKNDDTYNILYAPLEGENFVQKLGGLAAWSMEDFTVDADMISCSICNGDVQDVESEVRLSAALTPVTTICNVTLEVENLNNVQVMQGVLRGFASGALVASNDRVAQSSVVDLYSFNLQNFDFTDSADGVASAQLITFGKVDNSAQTYEVLIDVLLNSGEKMSFTRDVTDQVEAQNNIKIDLNLTGSDNIISLPESVGTGFGVEAWGDRELIELL